MKKQRHISINKDFKKVAMILPLWVIMCCMNKAYCQYNANELNLEIKGNIKDDKGIGIEYIGIGLHRNTDSTLIKGTITDSIGNYKFNNLKSGHYIISIYANAKKKRFIGSVTLDTSNKLEVLDYIVNDNYIQLGMVQIKSSKQFITKEIDRITINLNNSVLTAGNSIYESLSKLPGITVYNNGEIRVNGNNDILIMIDGQANRQSGEERKILLSNLRSESVDKIDIYTNPPAKFDAQGSAVINIITKKDKSYSDVHATYAQRFMIGQIINSTPLNLYTIGVNFNYQIGNLKMSIMSDWTRSNESYQYDNVVIKASEYDRTTERSNRSVGNRSINNIRLNYDITKRNSLIMNARLSNTPYYTNSVSTINKFMNKSASIDSITNINIYNNLMNNNLEFFINSSNTFGNQNKSILNISAVYNVQNYNMISNYYSEENGINQNVLQRRKYSVNAFSSKIDFTTEYKGYLIEAGLKNTHITNNELFVTDKYQTFIYNENISALFTSVKKSFKKTIFLLGLRGEYTSSKGETDDTALKSVYRNYLNFFPSLQMQYTLNKQTKVGMVVNRRIVRPFYGDFNPNVYYNQSDLYSLRTGATLLNIQIQNKYEINFSHKNYYSSLSLTERNGIRTLFASEGLNNTIVYQPLNGRSTDIAFNNSYNCYITSNWQMVNNLNIYSNKLFLINNIERKQLSWDLSSTQIIKIINKLSGEFNCRYSSPFIAEYFKISGVFVSNLALRSQILRNNISLTFAIDDVFGTNKPVWNFNFVNLSFSQTPFTNERLFRVNAAYKFKTGNKFQMKNKQSVDFGEIR